MMTAQIPDAIYENGERYPLHGSPLQEYFQKVGWPESIDWSNTGLRRGYHATWELVDNRLYLSDLGMFLGLGDDERKQRAISDVFPGYDQRVFAHWYCGILRIPDGEQIESFHAGWGGEWERYRLIHIHYGKVSARSIEHTEPKPAPPEKRSVWQRLRSIFKTEGEA